MKKQNINKTYPMKKSWYYLNLGNWLLKRIMIKMNKTSKEILLRILDI